MIIERQLTRSSENEREVVLSPKNQYQLYKNAVSPFTDSLEYETSEDLVSTSLYEWEQIPEKDRVAKEMSISDIELAAKNSVSAQMSEEEAIGAIRGSVAHDISLLVGSHMRATLAQKPLYNATNELSSFDPAVLSLLDNIFLDHGVKRYWEDPLERGDIKPSQVIDFVQDCWSEIRTYYQFSYFKRRGRIIEHGSQWDSMWAQAYWYSLDQTDFEERVFDAERNRINTYLTHPLFENDQYLFLPIEIHPDLFVAAEEEFFKVVAFPGYRIQFKGRVDYHLRNSVRDIYVDKKFGSYNSLSTEVTEAQALAYMHGASNLPSYMPYSSLTPHDSFFYADWYDVWSNTPSSYLVDLTVLPSRLEIAQQNLASYTHNWYENNEEFKHIKRERENALICPFLADPN